mmetsp:Transcript_23807/g.71599  ORF Transcript_23807/g.71599 Transcript_23807/m.71599 type:complete len:184 (+) Transcript_23807:358-909(+)
MRRGALAPSLSLALSLFALAAAAKSSKETGTKSKHDDWEYPRPEENWNKPHRNERWMPDGPRDVLVQFKLVPTIPAFEALPKAAGLAEGVGLTRLRRTFRAAPKHEAKHVKAGLHLWYQAAAPDATAADAAVASLLAERDVEKAEVDKEVKLLQKRESPDDRLFEPEHLKIKLPPREPRDDGL